MYSTLDLYANCKIIPERRIKVEDIQSFLSESISYEPFHYIIDKFQYVKHGLDIEIKVAFSQESLDYAPQYNWNYVRIVNKQYEGGVVTPTYPVYYFVISKKWIAQDTLKLVLKMDTINTFYDHLEFNAKTQILREHKVSHVKSGTNIYPVIDFNSEGLFPQLYNSKTGYYANKKIEENSDYKVDWYIIYMNRNIPTSETEIGNPVDFFLSTSEVITIPYHNGSQEVYDITQNRNNYKCLTFTYGDCGQRVIKFSTSGADVSYTLGEITIHPTYNNHRILVKSVSVNFIPNNVEVIVAGLDLDENNQLVNFVPSGYSWLYVATDCAYARDLDDYQYILNYPQYIETEQFLIRWSTGYGAITTMPIAQVDRTDSRIIKVIKIPYAPIDFLNNPTIMNSFRVNYENGKIIGLTNGIHKFENTFNPVDYYGNAIKPFEFLNPMAYPPQYWEQYSVDDEPKMFHSEFFCVKLVYDSFVLNLPAEALGGGSASEPAIADNFSLTFTMSTTMNSRFMWTVNNYITKYGSENFDNVLIVARNNELPIYTNAYLNYIRTGFNYDLKAKTTREASAWAGLGLSVLGGAMAGNFAGGVGAVAGAVVGAVAGLVGAITSTIQAENTFNKNLQSLEWQTSSVRDSNDVDLMSQYCGNRLQVFYYIASPKVRQQVERLFYYYGYKSERIGLPNPNIRIGWDFLQCKAEFNRNQFNIPEEFITDIKMQLEAGVTFIHKIATANPEDNSHWDIDQQYANYEKSIM